MDLKTQLNDSVKDAMKIGDVIRKDTARMTLEAIKQVEVDKRASLDDAAVMSLLQKEIKNCREALEAFLPKAMPADELRAPVKRCRLFT